MGKLRKLYEALKLPTFREVVSNIRRYTASLCGYQKNRFPVLQPEIEARIGDMWRASIKEWGYDR